MCGNLKPLPQRRWYSQRRLSQIPEDRFRPAIEDSSDEASCASADVHEGAVISSQATMAGDPGALVGFLSQLSASVLSQDSLLPSREMIGRFAREALQHSALPQQAPTNLGITGLLLLLRRPLARPVGWIFRALQHGLLQEGDVEATREAEERPHLWGAP